MSMLEDFSNSVKAQLYDRVSSPFLGAYAISWALWNYKIVLIAISDMKGYEKLSYIENNLTSWTSCTNFNGLYSHWANCHFWLNWIIPLLTALFYIYWWPSINTKIMVAYKKRQNYHKAMQLKMDRQTPISFQEAIRVRKEAKKIRDDYEGEISHYQKQVEKVQSDYDKSVESSASLTSKIEVLTGRLRDFESKASTESSEVLSTKERKKELEGHCKELALAIVNFEKNLDLETHDLDLLYTTAPFAIMDYAYTGEAPNIETSDKSTLLSYELIRLDEGTYRITTRGQSFLERYSILINTAVFVPPVITPPTKQSDTPDPA